MPVSVMLAAAAGAMLMPSPLGNPNRWLSTYDIPQDAFREGKDGAFFYKAIVNPRGEVEHCQVEQSPASRADQEAFCNRVKGRFKFTPAADPSGAPSYSVLEENYAYILPERWLRNPLERRPDMVVDVRKLPSGARDGKLAVNVHVAVDAAGALRQCDPAGTGAPAGLGRVACSQLAGEWLPVPERNAAGEAVPYVRQMIVEFREGAPGN